jgi:hypothetical protein
MDFLQVGKMVRSALRSLRALGRSDVVDNPRVCVLVAYSPDYDPTQDEEILAILERMRAQEAGLGQMEEPEPKTEKPGWPSWEPWQSSAHDDRCECPGCRGLEQDDVEFFSGTGQYAEDEGGFEG